MSELTDKIRDKCRERDYLLDVLDLWDVATKAGFKVEDVKAFTFRPTFLAPNQKDEDQASWQRHRRSIYNASEWHNCVRLNNGDLRPIPLTRRPSKHDT